ncbi:neurotrypsin-like [Acanthaster planci]|uniref:Neurotrypsin-like n=1 Tax=Acanthaster planci TaxID=133434 RepID=A0A8B7ZY75_ACAPL|nr:neurotrypsin-like [Acanthaster planci]
MAAKVAVFALWTWWMWFAINLTSHSCSSTSQKGDIVRLFTDDVNGTQATGLLQVSYKGDWWWICGLGVNLTVSSLVCRQLGFTNVSWVNAVNDLRVSKQERFGRIECEGTEKTLTDCKYYLDETYSCPLGVLAEIKCKDNMATPLPDFQVRLVGGTFPYEGRVEISYNGQWGTVCDDSWDYKDADVVCQQLGFHTAEAIATTAYFGEGSGPILLDDVACEGNETSIVNCPHSGIGEHNCKHSEDAGVRCTVNKTQLETLSPEITNSILPFLVILINGLIALLILVGCLIYCYLKLWDRYTGRTRRAQLRRTQDASTQGGATGDGHTPWEYTEDPPPYHTVHENRDVYIMQQSETPPP